MLSGSPAGVKGKICHEEKLQVRRPKLYVHVVIGKREGRGRALGRSSCSVHVPQNKATHYSSTDSEQTVVSLPRLRTNPTPCTPFCPSNSPSSSSSSQSPSLLVSLSQGTTLSASRPRVSKPQHHHHHGRRREHHPNPASSSSSSFCPRHYRCRHGRRHRKQLVRKFGHGHWQSLGDGPGASGQGGRGTSMTGGRAGGSEGGREGGRASSSAPGAWH